MSSYFHCLTISILVLSFRHFTATLQSAHASHVQANDVCANNRYENQAALDFHVKSDIGVRVGKAFKEEDLVESPMKIIFVKSVGGYASKL